MSGEDWILTVVQSFYSRARADVLIGYHFRVIPDFETHIPRIAAFWEIQLLGSTKRPLTDSFDVMRAHLPLGIKRGELGRWLVLFRQTLNEEVKIHPGLAAMKRQWEEKLTFFEDAFLRFFGL